MYFDFLVSFLAMKLTAFPETLKMRASSISFNRILSLEEEVMGAPGGGQAQAEAAVVLRCFFLQSSTQKSPILVPGVVSE